MSHLRLGLQSFARDMREGSPGTALALAVLAFVIALVIFTLTGVHA